MTYLYIKQHKVTGKLYFGKTKKHPEVYHGSGTYWKKHLKKHGMHIETLWWCFFPDVNQCSEFAVSFSIINNIVSDISWANQMIEDGINGQGSPGRILSDETKQKISIGNTGKRYSKEQNLKKGRSGNLNSMFGTSRTGESSPHYGKPHNEKTKSILSEKAKNKNRLCCLYCKKEVDVSNANRWHLENCKLFVFNEP